MRRFLPALALLLAAAAPARGKGLDLGRFVRVEAGRPGSESPGTVQAKPHLTLYLGGLLEVLAGGEPGQESGFTLPRARLILEGRASKLMALKLYLALELSPLSDWLPTPLADAYLSFNLASKNLFDVGRITVGQFKVPFGRLLGQAPERLLTSLRPLGYRCLGPGRWLRDAEPEGTVEAAGATGRDIGIAYSGEFLPGPTRIFLAAGIFSGAGPLRRAEGFGPLAALRFELDVLRRKPGGWRVGVGGSYAYNPSTILPGLCRPGFTSVWDPAINGSARGEVHRYGADLIVTGRGFHLQAEWLGASLEETPAPEAHSVATTVGYFVIGDFLQLVFQHEWFARSSALFPDTAGEFHEFVAGVNLVYLRHRFVLRYNYVYRLAVRGGEDEQGHLVTFLLSL